MTLDLLSLDIPASLRCNESALDILMRSATPRVPLWGVAMLDAAAAQGDIIELLGETASGKSHLACVAAARVLLATRATGRGVDDDHAGVNARAEPATTRAPVATATLPAAAIAEVAPPTTGRPHVVVIDAGALHTASLAWHSTARRMPRSHASTGDTTPARAHSRTRSIHTHADGRFDGRQFAALLRRQHAADGSSAAAAAPAPPLPLLSQSELLDCLRRCVVAVPRNTADVTAALEALAATRPGVAVVSSVTMPSDAIVARVAGPVALLVLDATGGSAFWWQDRAWGGSTAAAEAHGTRQAAALHALHTRYGTRVVATRRLLFSGAGVSESSSRSVGTAAARGTAAATNPPHRSVRGALRRPGAELTALIAADSSNSNAAALSAPSVGFSRSVVAVGVGGATVPLRGLAPPAPPYCTFAQTAADVAAYAEVVRTTLPTALARAVSATVLLTKAVPVLTAPTATATAGALDEDSARTPATRSRPSHAASGATNGALHGAATLILARILSRRGIGFAEHQAVGATALVPTATSSGAHRSAPTVSGGGLAPTPCVVECALWVS